MEITVHSTLPVVGGHVTVSADPNQTVDTLITAFCIEKSIPCKKEYVIRNKDQQELWNGQKLSSCNLISGETVFLGIRDTVSEWPCGCNQWWILAFVAFVTGAVGITALSLKRAQESEQPENYGVVFDAGSSHTSMYIYKWKAEKENGTGVVTQHSFCKAAGPGISAYVNNPGKAGKSLEYCLDQAKDEIPETEYKRSPIFLGATAGMRLLRDSGEGNTSEAILNSVRSTFKKYPFHFNNSMKQARIIDGMEEGSFSWVTVNYVADAFSTMSSQLSSMLSLSSSSTLYGALDMGGASTQITFIPESLDDIQPGYNETLLMFGSSYQVYTHSYLCYGLNEAYMKYLAALVISQAETKEGPIVNITSPCHPVGNETHFTYAEIFEAPCTNSSQPKVDNKNITYIFMGQSDNTFCDAFVQENLFAFNNSCSNCSFNGVYQPPVYGEFYAFSGYYINLNFLNVTDGSLADYYAAIESYCNKTYAEILLHYASLDKPSFLVKFCFNNHFIITLLTKGYKFDDDTWKQIHFTDKIAQTDLGWSLGFMLNSTNRIPARQQTYSLGLPVFVILILLFLFFLLLAACFCVYARRLARTQQIRKYQRLSTYGAVDT